MYKLFLCLRYLRKRRMVFFAIAAVTLCTAMVLIVVSVMGGFLDMVRERSRGLLGDIVMEGSIQGFPYYQEFIDHLEATKPDLVLEASPVIVMPGLLRIEDTRFAPSDPNRTDMTRMVRFIGLRLDEARHVTDFGESLYYDKYYPGSTTLGLHQLPVKSLDAHRNERLPDELEKQFQVYLAQEQDAEAKAKWLPRNGRTTSRPGLYTSDIANPRYVGEERPGVVIGVDIVAYRTEQATYDRLWPRGNRVVLTVLPINRRGGLSASGPISIPARYIDDSRTGVYEIDSVCVYVGFDLLQSSLDMDEQEPQDNRLLSLGRPAELIDALDEHRIHDDIRQSLAEEYVDLSEQASVKKDKPSEWEILDGNVRLVARLEQEEQSERLNIYRPGVTRPSRTFQVQIKLHPGTDPRAAKKEIVDLWKAFRADYEGKPDGELMGKVDDYIQTWEEKQGTFIAAVEKEKVLVTILFGVISVVAVFLVGCIFYMIVQEKTRDIGILKAVGASASGVASVFLAYGVAVGVVGSVVGSVLGAVFVNYINEFQDLLTKINPSLQVWSPQVYSFDRIPNTVKSGDLVGIMIVAIIASMLGALWAARRAARVWPVEALRYE